MPHNGLGTPGEGLRIGEAIKLDRGDVDWAQGVLLIRESKFGKSRLVPLHASSMAALHDYARLRDQLQSRPQEPSFFVSLTGNAYSFQHGSGRIHSNTQARVVGQAPFGRQRLAA